MVRRIESAGMDGGTDKRVFEYDSEADAYYAILNWLDEAVNGFDESSVDKILKDPVYNGNVQKWRKLANTLRLEIALNIQNISEEKSREYAAKSMGMKTGCSALWKMHLLLNMEL